MQNKPYDTIALVLQGGGALGSYQVGVYQALCESGYTPDWVAGTSIGAINGAILAGNKTEESHRKLEYFWNRAARDDMLQGAFSKGEARKWYNYNSGLMTLLYGTPRLFLPRPLRDVYFQNDAEKISFYDPLPLRKLLQESIDFDHLNQAGNMRLTIDAVNIKTGKRTGFDNKHMPLLIDHIMACAALPPAMPAVRIGNDLY